MWLVIWAGLGIVLCAIVTAISAAEGADGEETIERVGSTAMFVMVFPFLIPLAIMALPFVAIYYVVQALSNR